MAVSSAIVVSNERVSGTDEKPLKKRYNFKEGLSHPHHTDKQLRLLYSLFTLRNRISPLRAYGFSSTRGSLLVLKYDTFGAKLLK